VSTWIRNNVTMLGIAGVLVLAAGSGFLTSMALGSSQQEPTRTVTINVATGPTGPPGPQGPPGAVECNPGYGFGNLVINAPGGQVTIQTCIKD
jgi:hypothetical protein